MSDDVLLAKVLTVSDGVVHGTREDASGAALVQQLTEAGWNVVEHRVTADGADNVANTLREMCGGFAGLIVSTGGTGFAPRAQPPAGTREAIERRAPGSGSGRHSRSDRTRGAGIGGGDATGQPTRTVVAWDRRSTRSGGHLQH